MPVTAPVPVATWKALVLLCSIFVLALVDLSLSLVHLGLTSFFLGLAASSATIIHTLTQLVIIVFRSRHQSRPSALRTIQWEDDLPPTSKMACLAMDVLLAVLFAGAFVTTLLVRILGYFTEGGSTRDIPGGVATFKVAVKVVYADAVMEALCIILLITLAVLGRSERRRFLEVQRKIPVSNAAA